MSPRNSKPVPDSGTTSKRNPRGKPLKSIPVAPPKGSKPPKPAREKLPDGTPIVTPLRQIRIKRPK